MRGPLAPDSVIRAASTRRARDLAPSDARRPIARAYASAMSAHAAPAIDTTPEWQALALHHAMLRDVHLRDLFAADPEPRRTG